MSKSILKGIETRWRNLCHSPDRAPPGLERLVAVGLGAEPQDTRLGDLSERYVRFHERVRLRLGPASWALAVSHLAADLHYALDAANVILFARAVDPGLRMTESANAAIATIDLRERTMNMLRVTAGKLVLPGLLLLGSTLLVTSAVDVWSNWRHTEALLQRLQIEKAETAAMRIEQHIAAVQSQIGWTTPAQWTSAPLEQRRFDFMRLLRQTPAITEIAQLDGNGREVLRVSRLAMDKVASGDDFANDPRYTEAKAQRVYFGPVYFRKSSEPYLPLALASAGHHGGVIAAEVNLKFLWDVTRAIGVGDTGFAYVVDGKGRLIAHRDLALVLRKPDLSALPQVAAALTGAPASVAAEGRSFAADLAGTEVISVHATIPSLGWRVFVDLPAAEARTPLWNAVLRAGAMLGLGLVAALLASVLVARRIAIARPAVV